MASAGIKTFILVHKDLHQLLPTSWFSPSATSPAQPQLGDPGCRFRYPPTGDGDDVGTREFTGAREAGWA